MSQGMDETKLKVVDGELVLHTGDDDESANGRSRDQGRGVYAEGTVGTAAAGLMRALTSIWRR